MNQSSNFTPPQLVKELQSNIPDISLVYNHRQLSMIYDAVHGDDFIIPMDKRTTVALPKKAEKKLIVATNRKKIRIDLTIDNSYAEPLMAHLEQFDKLKVIEIKTGLAIKNVCGGYVSNIINYNELRTINGVLYGNLYFNVIRSEEDFDCLNIDRDIKWFRGFALIPKVSIYDAIEYLSTDVVTYLKGLNKRGNKRRLHNASKLFKST
ncbi:hypothetical protein N8508_00250 [bacterium]|nr:hypothetical protein [bacterium]